MGISQLRHFYIHLIMGDLPKDFIEPVHKTLETDQDGGFVRENLSVTPREISAGIDNTNRNFKGQQKNEVVVAFCRKHWIVIVPHMILSVLLMVAPLVIFMFRSRYDFAEFISVVAYRTIAGIAIIGITYFFHMCFLKFFNYYLQTFIITNFRVVQLDQTLYFTRNRDSIDLREIQDIEIHQKGFFPTILNYGELIITLSSAHATKHIAFTPNPEYYFKKVNNTKREYIIARGVEKKSQ